MATITNTIRWASNTEELKRNLKDGLNQIEATRAGAERMVKSLSGDKLTQAAHNFAAAVQQLGGVEKLTNAERERGNALLTKAIEKYNVLGQTAPKALQDMAVATSENVKQATLFGTALGTIGGLFAARAVLNFGRELFASADALKRMSDQTGITVEGLQLLQAAGDEAGNTIEEITAAILQLENRLGGGDSGAAKALKTIGVSLEDLQRLSPDQQFREIGVALLAVEDPAKQVALAIDLFGKSGAKVLPTLKANFDEIGKSAFTMSAGTVDAFDRMGDAVARLYRNTKAIGGTFLAAIYEFFEAPVIRAARQFENFQKMVAGIKRPPVTTGVTTPPGLPGDAELANITKDLNDQLRAKNALTKEAEEAEKKAQEATERWAAAGQRLLETLDRLEIVTPGLRQSVGELNSVELKNVETWLAKIKAGEQLYETLRKLEQIKAGELDIGALPSGTVDIETISRLKQHLDDVQTSGAALRMTIQSLTDDLRLVGTVAGGTFGEMVTGIASVITSFQSVIVAIQNATSAMLTLNAALGIFGLGFQIGSLIARAFRRGATGGIVAESGIQHFAGGGFAQPAIRVPRYAQGTDSVPALLTPGEMILNAGQQARLFQVANGRASGGAGNMIENHYHTHNWDLRQAVVTNDQGLDRLSREVARRNATGIARNHDSINTRGRAGYGLRS